MALEKHKRIGLWVALAAAIVVSGCGAGKKPSYCRNPKYVPVMKEQAVSYYNKGKYIEALKSAKEAEACKPKDAELYYWIGLIYVKRDMDYDAIEALKKSLEIDPDYTEAHMALGMVYLKLERWDEAIKEFDFAARDELYTSPWIALNNLGWAYMQKGDLDMAELSFKKALDQNNKFCPTYCNLGELYSKRGDSSKAIMNFNIAINLCPQNYARPHFLLALEYGRMGQFNYACKHLNQAARTPNAPESQKAIEYMRIYNCPGTPMLPGSP